MGDDEKAKKHTGKVKWVDSQGIVGYIVYNNNNNNKEILFNPSSVGPTNSNTIQEGDQVRFSVKRIELNPPHLKEVAFDVTPFGVECFSCNRKGHKSWDCPQFEVCRVECFKCGLKGHKFRDCDQKLPGWVSDGSSISGAHRLSRGGIGGWSNGRIDKKWRKCKCGNGCCWGCLFGCCHVSGRGKRVGSVLGAGDVVCVEKWEDVKKVEEVEDCFILEFDPSDVGCRCLKDDGDGKGVVCVKRREDVSKVEEVEDCFILEFDPDDECVEFSKLSLSEKSKLRDDEEKEEEEEDDSEEDSDDDVVILSEKGQVPCRDYPHPRHLCASHPFKKTSPEVHCKMCYCYVCDVPAPCKEWNNGFFKHCEASEGNPFWRSLRDLKTKKKDEVNAK